MNDGPLPTPDPKTLPVYGGSRLRNFSLWVMFGLMAVIGAEFGARLDDLVFGHIGLLETSSEENLWTRTNGIFHGVPHARFKGLKFNNVGLGGPDIAARPPEGCKRYLFLGSSETFSEPSSYVSRLSTGEATGVCGEFLNAAIPGMTVASMTPYFREHLSQFHPDVVFIYPATHFYLSSDPPKPAPRIANSTPTGAREQLVAALRKVRMLERLQDAISVPETIQARRRASWIEAETSGKPADWLFRSAPPERAELLVQHLDVLVAAVRESGAKPVLFTQGVRVTNPPTEEDLWFLTAMRVWAPRATEPALAAFPYLANQRIRDYAAAHDIDVIDVASELSGERDKFVDMVHYAPDGHRRIAQLVDQFLSQRTGN